MSDDGANVPDDVMREERALREQGIREASQTLERIARQAAKRENPSLAETDMDLGEVKVAACTNSGEARKTLKQPNAPLRSWKRMSSTFVVASPCFIASWSTSTFLLKKRSAFSTSCEAAAAAEIGDIRASTEEVEDLLEDMIGGNTSTLNPFLFRHFWMGVDTRWPAGGETGVLLVRIINDGNSYADVAAKATCSRGLDGEPTERGFAHHRPGWQHPSSL